MGRNQLGATRDSFQDKIRPRPQHHQQSGGLVSFSSQWRALKEIRPRAYFFSRSLDRFRQWLIRLRKVRVFGPLSAMALKQQARVRPVEPFPIVPKLSRQSVSSPAVLDPERVQAVPTAVRTKPTRQSSSWLQLPQLRARVALVLRARVDSIAFAIQAPYASRQEIQLTWTGAAPRCLT